MDAFEAFQKYLALKQHFTKEGYDYFKYGGKVTAKISSFETRKDKYLFHKLSKKKDVEGYLVANLIVKENTWVRDLIDGEAEQVYLDWLKRQQSITYIFENDVCKMEDNLEDNILIKDKIYPHILSLYFQHEICIESLIIIDDILKVFKYWKNECKDMFLWPEVHTKLIKYRPFVKFDKKLCKQILKNKFLD